MAGGYSNQFSIFARLRHGVKLEIVSSLALSHKKHTIDSLKLETLRTPWHILSFDPIVSQVAYFAEVLSENAARPVAHGCQEPFPGADVMAPLVAGIPFGHARACCCSP